MEGIHSGFSRTLVLNPIQPLTSGGAFDLAKGQIGLVMDKAGKRGLKATNDITVLKNMKYYLEVGNGKGKGLRTVLFSPQNVLEVTHDEFLEPTQAVVFLGFNGINDDSLDIAKGESTKIHLSLKGDYLASLGYKDGEYFESFTISEDYDGGCVDCNNECEGTECYERTLKLAETIRNSKLKEGIVLSDIIKVTPTFSNVTNPTATSTADMFLLVLVDGGEDVDLAKVKAQYAGYSVERVSREGQSSTYQIIVLDSTTPADYVVWEGNLKTDCGTCTAGYTLEAGGFMYSVALEDEGTDKAGDISALLTSATTVTRIGEEYGIGKYAVIAPVELPQAEIDALIAGEPTVKIDINYTTVSDVCIKDALDKIAWTANGSCDISEKEWVIELADTNCGDSRLTELQKAYPDLTITEGTDATDSSDCRKKYYTKTPTNVVCDECYPDFYKAYSPSDFEYSAWKEVEVASLGNVDTKCGLRFEAIPVEICPEIALAGEVATIIGQTEIQVSGGIAENHIIGYKSHKKAYEFTRDSRAFNGAGWGCAFSNEEEKSLDYFLNQLPSESYTERVFKGTKTVLDPCGKYEVITLKIKREILSQGFSRAVEEFFRYKFIIPQGSFQMFKPFFNMVSAGNTEINNI